MSIVKLNNNGVKNATAFGSGVTSLGIMTFIKKLTASSSSTLSFVDGSSSVVLDNTYKEYLFTFKDIHNGDSSQVDFQFNLSADSGSNYNVTKTTTNFYAFNSEPGYGNEAIAYGSSDDLAQGTGFQPLGDENQSNDNDHGQCGILYLFNPSDTTFVKHFIATNVNVHAGDYIINDYIAGYGNTTSAVDAIQFKYHNGNIDAGDICLYGIN